MQNRSGTRRRTSWIIAGVVVAALLVGGFFFFRSRQAQQPAIAEDEINSVAAFVGDLSGNATATGQIEASQSASLAVASPGKVTQVLCQSQFSQ